MGTGVFRQGLAVATHPAWWIIAGMGATVLVVALLTTTSWALATARKTAAALNPSTSAWASDEQSVAGPEIQLVDARQVG